MDFHHEYSTGTVITWWGFSSCTLSVHVLQSELFLSTKKARTMFTIECDSGKDIQQHSWYRKEQEILLLAGTQFRVVSSLMQSPDNYTIQLEEIKSFLPILYPVQPAPILNRLYPSKTNDMQGIF